MATATARTFRPTGTIEAVRVIALGVNLWAIILVFPILHIGLRNTAFGFITALPLAPLIAGAWALGSRPGTRVFALSTLIVMFPVSIAGALAFRSDLGGHAQTTIHAMAGALSLLAYGSVALEACARPSRLRASTTRPLPALPGDDRPSRVWLRRVLVFGTVLGGCFVSVLAPTMNSREELVRAWGESAGAAPVFASIMGAVASAAAIAGIVGPSLRAPRPAEVPRPSQKRARILLSLSLSMLSLAGYAALRALEHAP